ncbi:hypothetical protein Gotur_026735 [Gossypium turneri]
MLKVHKIIHKHVRFLQRINQFQPLLMNVVAIGKRKGYMKSVPLANGSYAGTKPMKVDSKEVPISLFWGEKLECNSQNEDLMYKDMEDFLFKMLGKEFRLERDVIGEVLNSSGYNMQKVWNYGQCPRFRGS